MAAKLDWKQLARGRCPSCRTALAKMADGMGHDVPLPCSFFIAYDRMETIVSSQARTATRRQQLAGRTTPPLSPTPKKDPEDKAERPALPRKKRRGESLRDRQF